MVGRRTGDHHARPALAVDLTTGYGRTRAGVYVPVSATRTSNRNRRSATSRSKEARSGGDDKPESLESRSRAAAVGSAEAERVAAEALELLAGEASEEAVAGALEALARLEHVAALDVLDEGALSRRTDPGLVRSVFRSLRARVGGRD